MAKFPLYQWKKATGAGDTTGLAKLNANNTFTGKNTFESTANVVSIKSTDDQSFGIEFENNTGQRVGYIGTSNNEATKATVWGANGLILQTTNSPIEIKSGNRPLTYTTSNNSKDRREVLVRNDLYYIKKASSNAFNVPASGYQTAGFTITGLERQTLNEFLVILTTNRVDITFEFKIYCNVLTYRNMSDVKTISIAEWDTQDLDRDGKLIQFGLVQTGNNQIRYRIKNLSTSQIDFTSIRIYHRIPGKIADN